MQDADVVELLLHRPDLLGRLGHPCLVEPARHRQRLGVLGDRAVGVAARAHRAHHLLDGVAAVGAVGVHVEVGNQVLLLDQLRQRVVPRQPDLALGFAQLGRNPIQAERAVHLLLGAARDHCLVPSEAVLVEAHALVDRELAQLDVVLLAAGEVEHRGAEGLLRDEAQVHLQPAAQPHRGLGLALPQHLDHQAVGGERGHHRLGPAAAHQHVEVADGLLAAPERAGQLHLGHARWPTSQAPASGRRPDQVLALASDWRIFCSVFSPNPASSRSLPSFAAAASPSASRIWSRS